jgi:hypothetical protein
MKSWFVRMYRGRRLDRNPLRRPIDRTETVIGIWLLVGCAAAAPFTARAAAAGTRTLAGQARITALATRHEVTAITLEKAPPAGNTSSTPIAQTWVSATWTAPDGRQRTGWIQVPDSTRKGSPERIWVTGNGDVAAPPLPVTGISLLAGRAAFGAITVLIFLGLAAGSAVRHVINRRNMAAWDAEWTATEPLWNHQR